MGRRRSLVGALLTELERSSRRAASDARRAQHRVEGARFRALEREMVRQERALDRARIQNERDAERAAALHSRERARQLKVQEKENQLREWRLEVQEYAAKDERSLTVANEGPEVEDREGLFAELQQPRVYEPPDFVSPSLPPELVSRVHQHHQTQALEKSTAFHEPLSTLNAAQFVFAGFGLLGGAATILPQAPSVASYLGAASLGVWAILERTRASRWQTARASYLSGIQEDTQAKIAAELATEHRRLVESAKTEHEAACAGEEAGHAVEQARRLKHVQALLRGEEASIKEELQEVFPLELEPEVKTTAEARPPGALRLSLQPKLSTALQSKVGSLLTSGKPSFKMKTQKQLKAEGQRYLAGLALRHASEAMLFLPTVGVVVVEVALLAIDAARGVEVPQRVLEVSYTFATLAPLQMADIDPVEALSHFEHKWQLGPIDAEVKRMVAK